MIKTKQEIIKSLDGLIAEIELTPTTRGLLNELYAICQRNDRNMDREKMMKGKLMKNDDPKIKMPESQTFTEEDFKKKAEIIPEPQPEPTQTALPAKELEVDQKPETNEMQIFDLYVDGIEGAIAKFPKPKAFQKHLKSLGIESEGKTHQDLWKSLEEAYNKIS